MPQKKITKLFVQGLGFPTEGQLLYWDTELPGFGLRVGKKTKAFIAEAKVKRKTVRVTVGTFPRMTAEVARQEAREALQNMERDIDPRRVAEGAPSLSDAYAAFKAARQLAVRTLADYGRYYDIYFKAWQSKPVNEITSALVSKRHLDLADKHGQAQANAAMRFLRSVLYFAQAEYGKEVLPENPVRTLGHKRQWFRELPRQNVLKAHQLPAWFEAVLSLKNDETSKDRETFRDYFLLLLFLGLRRSEGAKLKVEHVDLKARTITILETKNHQPKVLPFGPHVEEILKRRQDENPGSPWVFWSALDPKKHIVEPRKALAEVLRNAQATHTIHDIRRSFATFLEGLDTSVYAAQRLMGHKSRSDDVLGRHYVVTDVERLRPAVVKLESFLLSAAGIQQEEVTQLSRRRQAKK